ncbi:MAG TPA: hypothetical protein VF377_09315 [Acidimicrobiia bacterium]|jgi:hypothetical protein
MFRLDDYEKTEVTDERPFPLRQILIAVAVIVAAVLLALTVLGLIADEPPPRMVPVQADAR